MLFRNKQAENRAYPRVDFFQPSYFIVENSAVPSANDCWFNNISLGGISFESEMTDLDRAVVSVLYKIGARMRKDTLQVQFSKKLMSKWRYGCRFLHPDEQRSALIGEYITRKIGDGEVL